MGYTYTSPTFRVEFDDERLAGLELVTRSFTVDELLAVVRLEAGFNAVEPDEVEALLDKFIATVTEWNLQRPDRSAIPLTRDGIGRLDHQFVTLVIRGWMKAVAGGVPAPLGKRSPDGVPPETAAPEVFLPVRPLASPPN